MSLLDKYYIRFTFFSFFSRVRKKLRSFLNKLQIFFEKC